jgi:hypothetical protein
MTGGANDGTILRLTIFRYYEVWTARTSAGLSGKALMAKRNWRRLTIASALVAAGSALAVPAGAQFFTDRTSVPERARPQQVQLREFFPFQWWGGERGGQNTPFFGQPARPPVDYSKAPPPHKQEAPLAATVLVIGDSLADWLGYGLEEALADTPEVGVVRKIKGSAGLIRYEARSDTPDWSQAAKELLASEKPNAVVVMLGLNDRQSLRERAAPRAGAQRNGNEPASPAPPAQPANQTSPTPAQGNGETPPAPSAAESPDSPTAVADAQRRVPGASYEFHTDKWAELYGKRVDEMIAVLKAKGVPVLWVGLPALRGPRSTTDVSYLDELYRAHAEKAGITYVDVWDGFVDDGGHFTMQGPDFEGQIRKLRSGDGVHFTKAGAVKLGYYVERELRRVLSSHTLPVALPGPEQSPAKGGARPVVGPVVPLGAIGAGEGTDLLGANNHPAQAAASDPIVTRVLSHGDSIAAAPGRADDFSWPRGEAGAKNAGSTAEVEAPPAAPAPSAKPPAAGKPDAKKPGDAKANDARANDAKAGEPKASDPKTSDAKPLPAPEAPPAKPRRSRVDLDGAAPRPPMPVGGTR